MLTVGKQDFRVATYLDNKDNISINSSGAAFVKLTTLSDLPESIDVNNFYGEINVYVTKFSMLSLYDNISDPDEERKNHIWEVLSQQLIELTPDIKSDRNRPNKYWWWGDSVKVRKLNKGFDPHKQIKLVSMPVFSKDNSSTGIESVLDFEKALQSGKLLGKLKAEWPRDKFDVPGAVIWKSDDFDLTVYTGINQQTHVKYGITYILDLERAKKLHITIKDTDWISSQYQFDDVIYVPSNIVFDEYLPKANLLNDENESDENGQNIKETLINSIDAENTLRQTTSHIKSIEFSTKRDTKIGETSSREMEFLNRFKENTYQKGLYYTDSDLINFHMSMKSDGLVILSGLSGTGKSKLVTEYANALQISSADSGLRSQVRFVSVRPFWADDSDLLGYADTVNNVFRPGDSGLVDTLIDAQDNPDDLFIVVFDEMNLARVEHYFSQFLSVLEMDAGIRSLTLYNQQLENRLYNSEKYPANVVIGENVLFVGTVNTDESTHQFSDKVLDRSNVITLEMVPFDSVDESPILIKERGEREVIKSDDFQKMKKINPSATLTSKEKSMLWELHKVINEVDVNIGIGWRIVKQIDNYLMNLPIDVETFNRGKALDTQIVQRILTKVRGSEDQMAGLLGESSIKGEHKKGKIEEILDKFSDSSDFEKSRGLINRKSKELKLYGFTV